MTSDAEGVRGRQAEYPDDEDARELAREASLCVSRTLVRSRAATT
ncbi:Uncharacterised protein [Actinomyces howellii]|uniref:Uncharacterized protein n=1 Tax=Actinomyces howellii TaxID=52771 RepID=A0A3S4R1Q7_9ACTO|nr:Uncharacterised protein [Actinomyces howellii]